MKFIPADKILSKIKPNKTKSENCQIIYEDPLLKKLETTFEEFFESDVPYHKILQIKLYNEIIWDRKKRYYKFENEYFD